VLCVGTTLGAFGLTEPDGGTDTGAARTRGRVVDGTKTFMTNSGTDITGLVTVMALTSEPAASRTISAIIVPSGTVGLTAEGA
jgi:short/branched chain acyl-CoA dehydrogenase